MTIESIINTLSRVRLSTYKSNNLCDSSDEQSLGLYLWNQQLSGHFFPILQILEVSLRNAIHNSYKNYQYAEIEKNFPTSKWGEKKRKTELWFTNIYNIKNNKIGMHQINTVKQKLIKEKKELSADNYVAKLTFGFWINMTNKNHRSNINTPPIIELWPNITQMVFPNAIDKNGKPLSINHINNELHTINQLRNRIAHHEPIWKTDNIFDADDAINNIVIHYDRCLKVIKWLNLDNLKLISIMENDKLMGDACNRHSLWKSKQLPAGIKNIPDVGNWSKNHMIDTRTLGTVINSTNKEAFIKSDLSKNIFYTNKKMQNRKSAWPLIKDSKVTFIPKPSESKYPDAIQVKQK